MVALQHLHQSDILFLEAEMVVEANRSRIGRAGFQREEGIALLTRPLLASRYQRLPGSLSLHRLTDSKLADVRQ